MPDIAPANILLNDMGFWPQPDTFYETQRFSDSAATYRFGCHQAHTSFTIKIDEAVFNKENQSS